MLVELLGRLHLTLGSLDQHMKDQQRRRLRHMQDLPALVPVTGVSVGVANNVVPASGILLLDLGGPQVGRRWLIRAVSISDAGNFSTSMGSAICQFYVGRHTSATAIAPQQVRWPFTVLPNAATFGSEELPVLPMDRLYCLFSGATSGQILQATALVQDLDPASKAIQETI